MEYCIEIDAVQGVISVGMENGTMTEAAGLYEWCVVPKDTYSQRLSIHSLTARAHLRVAVP